MRLVLNRLEPALFQCFELLPGDFPPFDSQPRLGEFVELAGRHAFDFRLLARIHMRLHAVDFLHRATENAGPFARRLTLLALTVGGHLGDEPWLQLADGVERSTMAFLREVHQRPDGLQRGVMP